MGYKIIQIYKMKRVLTRKAQLKISAAEGRYSLGAERKKEYFAECLKYSNEVEYHKYQLHVEPKTKEAALDSIDLSEPVPSNH